MHNREWDRSLWVTDEQLFDIVEVISLSSVELMVLYNRGKKQD